MGKRIPTFATYLNAEQIPLKHMGHIFLVWKDPLNASFTGRECLIQTRLIRSST